MSNAAFIFIKPAANNKAVQDLVKSTLLAKNVKIESEGEFTGEEIDKQMLIDQHYYAIASKATLLKPTEIPVPADKFEAFFGISWEKALADGSVYNAIDACKVLDVDATGLDAVWSKCKKVKFGGGFYCGVIEVEDKPKIYVFNAFFMTMRSKFVDPSVSIHYYSVSFSPSDLSWTDFRGKVLGPTDPSTAPEDSLRGGIFKSWESLGLSFEPTIGENSIHASASPFEGLAERMNWLKQPIKDDSFGSLLLESGLSEATIKEWSVDPQVKGKSVFDQLEDLDVNDCLQKLIELNN